MKAKILLFLLANLLSIQATVIQVPQEYAIKATFLFNFTRFITWPEEALKEDTPFIIGIVGKDPFSNLLTSVVENEKVQGRPIVIRYYTTAAKVEPCHLLFVNLTDRNEVRDLVEKAKSWHALTVGEQLIFERQGGMIRFVTQQNKTKLRINLSAAKDAGLTISSKLLNLAEIVEPKSTRP